MDFYKISCLLFLTKYSGSMSTEASELYRRQIILLFGLVSGRCCSNFGTDFCCFLTKLMAAITDLVWVATTINKLFVTSCYELAVITCWQLVMCTRMLLITTDGKSVLHLVRSQSLVTNWSKMMKMPCKVWKYCNFWAESG